MYCDFAEVSTPFNKEINKKNYGSTDSWFHINLPQVNIDSDFSKTNKKLTSRQKPNQSNICPPHPSQVSLYFQSFMLHIRIYASTIQSKIV